MIYVLLDFQLFEEFSNAHALAMSILPNAARKS
jgi:hypothetical protein